MSISIERITLGNYWGGRTSAVAGLSLVCMWMTLAQTKAQLPQPTITWLYRDEPTIGEWAYVTVTVQNQGGNALEGGITLSFPSIQTTDAMDSRLLVTYHDGDHLVKAYPGANIYDRFCLQVPANHAMIELVDFNWYSGESHSISVKVKPPSVGTFPIRVRSAMQVPDGLCDWINSPLSGSQDQQGWPYVDAGMNVTTNLGEYFTMGDSYVALSADGIVTWHGASGDQEPDVPPLVEAETLTIDAADIKSWPGFDSRGGCDRMEFMYRRGSSNPFTIVPMPFDGNADSGDKWKLPAPVGTFKPGDTVQFRFRGRSDRIVGDSGSYIYEDYDDYGGANYSFAVLKPRPDLTISEIYLSRSRVSTGDVVTIESGTKNIGKVGTAWFTRCKVRYYLGRSPGDLWRHLNYGLTPNYGEENGIGPGETETDRISWTVHNDLTPGRYYLTVIADADNQIFENYETNNSMSVPFDVVLKTFTITASAGTGGSVNPASRAVISGQQTTFTAFPNSFHKVYSVDGDGAGASWVGLTYHTAPASRDRALNFHFDPWPDLIINEMWSEPEIPVVNEPFVIRARVRNQGAKEANAPYWPNSIEMSFWINSIYAGGEKLSDYCSAIPANGGEFLFTSVPLVLTQAGAYSISAKADWNESFTSEVAEYDENNNSRAINVIVTNSVLYTISAHAGPGGQVSPASAQVRHGSSFTFEVDPDPGYYLERIYGDAAEGGLIDGDSYVIAPADQNRTLTFEFAQNPDCVGVSTIAKFQHLYLGFFGSDIKKDTWIYAVNESFPDATYPFTFEYEHDFECDTRMSVYVDAYNRDGTITTTTFKEKEFRPSGPGVINLRMQYPGSFPGRDDTYEVVARVEVFFDGFEGGTIPYYYDQASFSVEENMPSGYAPALPNLAWAKYHILGLQNDTLQLTDEQVRDLYMKYANAYEAKARNIVLDNRRLWEKTITESTIGLAETLSVEAVKSIIVLASKRYAISFASFLRTAYMMWQLGEEWHDHVIEVEEVEYFALLCHMLAERYNLALISASDGIYDDRVAVRWEPLLAGGSEANHYSVRRSNTEDYSQSVLVADNLVDRFFMDEHVAPGSTYYYWIAGHDDGGSVSVLSARDDGFATHKPEAVISMTGDLHFGEVVTNAYAERILSIRNDGNRVLSLSAIQFPEGFVGTWPGRIEPNTASNVLVRFSPRQERTYQGSIVVQSDATSGNGSISSSGTGISPLVTTRIIQVGGPLHFGNVLAGQSTISTLVASNAGNSMLNISAVSYPDGFSGAWPTMISPGQASNMVVVFSPENAQSYTGSIIFYSDATSGRDTTSCSGTGIVSHAMVESLVVVVQDERGLARSNVLVIRSGGGVPIVTNKTDSAGMVKFDGLPSGSNFHFTARYEDLDAFHPFSETWTTGRVTYSNHTVLSLDAACDVVYAAGLSNGMNGGYGYDLWQAIGSNSSYRGVFVGDSNNNGGRGGPGINCVDGKSWALYANSGNLSEAIRFFPITSLMPGQTISVEIDTGWHDGSNTSAGIGLLDVNGSSRFELYHRAGSANYQINDSASGFDTGIPWTDAGLVVSVTLNTATSYTAQIASKAGGSTAFTRNLAAGSRLDRVRFFYYNAWGDGGAERDFYFNSLKITSKTNTLLSLRRDMPLYMTHAHYDTINNNLLGIGHLAEAGQMIRTEMQVINQGTQARTVETYLLMDRDMLRPYDHVWSNVYQFLPGGGAVITSVFSAILTETGLYHAAFIVEDLSLQETDATPWFPAFNLVDVPLDRDGDGIPEAWVLRHFGATTNFVSQAMAANGRQTVWECYVSDIDPTDPDAALPDLEPGDVEAGMASFIIDPTSTARVYGLVWETNLSSLPANWNLEQPERTGTGSALYFEATNIVDGIYFRSRIRLP